MEKGFRHRILVRDSGKAMSAREAGRRQRCAEKAMTDSITELQPNTTMSQCASVFYGCKLVFPVLFSTFLYFFYFFCSKQPFFILLLLYINIMKCNMKSYTSF